MGARRLASSIREIVVLKIVRIFAHSKRVPVVNFPVVSQMRQMTARLVILERFMVAWSWNEKYCRNFKENQKVGVVGKFELTENLEEIQEN